MVGTSRDRTVDPGGYAARRPDRRLAPPACGLASADVVAAEDTRRLRRLTRDLGIELGGRVVSYFEGNEEARTPGLVEELVAGARVLVVTDAGMPSVSDPGYRLVAAAVEHGIRVTVRPGPVGGPGGAGGVGAPRRPVLLRGVPAPQGRDRARALVALAVERRTLVFFEAPHRLGRLAVAMARPSAPSDGPPSAAS